MPEPDLLPAERRAIWTEIGVVISLGVLVHTLGVATSWMHARSPVHERSVGYYLYAIGTTLQTILPLLWIMHRSGRPWSYFGIRRTDLRLDIPLSILIAVVIFAANYLARWIIYTAWYAAPWTNYFITFIEADQSAMSAIRTPPTSPAEWVAHIAYMLANGLSEELVLRAYLLVRIREVTGRPVLAALIVSALAAAYHLYQGSSAGLIIFGGQLAICATYFKVPRILPFARGHAFYDIVLSFGRA